MKTAQMEKFVQNKIQAWIDVGRITANELDRRHAQGAMEAYLDMQEWIEAQKARLKDDEK